MGGDQETKLNYLNVHIVYWHLFTYFKVKHITYINADRENF